MSIGLLRSIVSAVVIAAVLQGMVLFSPVHAQTVGSRTSVARGIDAQTQAALDPVFAQARDRGLPLDALSAKAAEGALRGVPSARIVAAVQTLEERLTTAKLALTPAAANDIVAGADALAVGVPADVLHSMRAQNPSASVAVPLAVLTQLVSQGVPARRAASIVLQLLGRGATPRQLVALRDAFNRAILAGKPASQALDSQTASMLADLGTNSRLTGSPVVAATAGASGSPMPAGTTTGTGISDPTSTTSHKH